MFEKVSLSAFQLEFESACGSESLLAFALVSQWQFVSESPSELRLEFLLEFVSASRSEWLLVCESE